MLLSRASPASGSGAAARRSPPSASAFFFPGPRQLPPLRDRRGTASFRPRPRERSVVTQRSVPDGDYGAMASAGTMTTVTTTTTPPPKTADAAPGPSRAPPPAGQFDWHRCWYPVALVESLKTDRPNALQLLGQPLVAWKPLGSDGDDGWVVQKDACPHRLAPLSEGRLETDGTLQW